MSEDGGITRGELNAIIAGLRGDITRLERDLTDARKEVGDLKIALFGSKFAFAIVATLGSAMLGVMGAVAYAKGWWAK